MFLLEGVFPHLSSQARLGETDAKFLTDSRKLVSQARFRKTWSDDEEAEDRG
jgi:hypothetical protein